MALKGILTWTNPTKYTDGTDYSHESAGAGYELSLDGAAAAVSLPFAFGTTFDMNELEQYRALKGGSHTVGLRVVTKAGVASEYAVATFQVALVPMAPASLAVA
jgi:hypothetical protein